MITHKKKQKYMMMLLYIDMERHYQGSLQFDFTLNPLIISNTVRRDGANKPRPAMVLTEKEKEAFIDWLAENRVDGDKTQKLKNIFGQGFAFYMSPQVTDKDDKTYLAKMKLVNNL
jgi:hypothetical protein